MDLPHCTAHSRSPAAWRCGACQRNLCEWCAASSAAGRGELAICATCGSLAEVILAPRADVETLQQTWIPSLRWLLHPKTILLVCVVTCATDYLAQVGPRSWLLGHAFELGWLFICVHRASWGHPPFSAPTYAELGTSWLEPMARLFVSIGFLAASAAFLVRLGTVVVSPLSPALWFLAAGAIWLVPPALAFACVEGSGTRWLPPWILPFKERELRGDLAPVRFLVGLWVLAAVANSFQPLLELNDTKIGDKIIEHAVVHLFAVAVLAALACVLGVLLRMHGKQLGHGDPAKWLVPIAPQAVPRGLYTPPLTPEPLEPELSVIELEDPRQALLDALKAGDANAALKQFRTGLVAPASLDADSLIQIAQAIAARGDYQAAAMQLRLLVARAPEGASAARASVILARLCAERLGGAAEATAIYQRVVERFPGTAAARFAAERLGEEEQKAAE